MHRANSRRAGRPDRQGKCATASRPRSWPRAPTDPPHPAPKQSLAENGVFVNPDILCNAAASPCPTSSGCRACRPFWAEADVDRSLERLMMNGFQSVMHEAERKHLNPRMAAYTLAVGRVAEAAELRGMVKNRHEARALSDAGMGNFRRQTTYKSAWAGERLLIAPRFYASSKRCSVCHHLKETLLLSERTYVCEACGSVKDRDLNAACNLAQLATTSSTERYACGESVSPGLQAVLVEAGTERQMSFATNG